MATQLTTNITINFGKHKGKKLSEIPVSYVEWLATIDKKDVAQAAQTFLRETKSDQLSDDEHGRFMKGRAYDWGYVGREEFEQANEQQRIADEEDEREEEETLACEWDAISTGRRIHIAISVYGGTIYLQKNDTTSYHKIDEIRPTTTQERVAHPDIVAVLGGVGLTQERKEAIERKAGK